jgi:AAA15 family ATPase/GTPase
MSSLDKLAIRGMCVKQVSSFGHFAQVLPIDWRLPEPGSRSFDAQEYAVMQFYSPLTVIVGHNGSGKTASLLLALGRRDGRL